MTARFACHLYILVLSVLLIFCPTRSWAHPVAQGALTITIAPDALVLQVRVAAEEAIVANAFAPAAIRATTIEAMTTAHARYLAEHMHVYVNGRRVPPLQAKPSKSLTSTDERIDYELRYSGLAGVMDGTHSSEPALAGELRIEQNVLNEFEFAPGNPWEATFIVNITDHGRAVMSNRLLTSHNAVIYNLAATTDRSQGTAAAESDQIRTFADYLGLGVMHILGGIDHLLFICALVLATVTLWDLVKIVTVFTLAHSLTLTLSVLDYVRLPEHVVEPTIAASIVVVALSNLLWPAQSRSNLRLLVAFAFGLFHGLGFAGGLLAAMEGLAGAGVALAIVGFSLGVEIGHQLVVLPLFGTLRLLRNDAVGEALRSPLQAAVLKYGSGAILIGGLVYLFAALNAASLGIRH